MLLDPVSIPQRSLYRILAPLGVLIGKRTPTIFQTVVGGFLVYSLKLVLPHCSCKVEHPDSPQLCAGVQPSPLKYFVTKACPNGFARNKMTAILQIVLGRPLGRASIAVRAQCNHLGVWPY